MHSDWPSDSIHVLHVLLEPRVGGPQLRILGLAEAMRPARIRTSVVLPTGPAPFKSYLIERGFEVFQLPIQRFRATLDPRRQAQALKVLPDSLRQLVDLFNKVQPDIIHAHGLYQFQGAIAARRCRLPLVWHQNDLLLPRPIVRFLAPSVLEYSRAVVTVSNAVKRYMFERDRQFASGGRFGSLRQTDLVDRPFAKAEWAAGENEKDTQSRRSELDSKVVTIYDPPIRVSPSTLGGVSRIKAPGTPERLLDTPTWVPNGLSFDRGEEFLGPKRRELKLLTLGNLYPVKGHLDLLKALKLLEVPFLAAVVGAPLDTKPAYSRSLWRLRGQYGLSKQVLFLGWQENVANYLDNCNLYVHPSLSEACPLAILEAMAAGKAVVATRVGGVPELVEDGVTGLLVPPQDPVALASAIRNLLNDQGRMKRMGQKGQERVESRFSLSLCTARHIALYRAVVNGRSPADAVLTLV